MDHFVIIYEKCGKSKLVKNVKTDSIKALFMQKKNEEDFRLNLSHDRLNEETLNLLVSHS